MSLVACSDGRPASRKGRSSAGAGADATPPPVTVDIPSDGTVADPEAPADITVQADTGSGGRVEREFEAAPAKQGEIEFDFERGVLEQPVTLANLYDKASKSFSQIDRTAYSKDYEQGAPGANKTDTTNQTAMGILDLVVVIDNSLSMAQEQSNLATKLAPLLQYVADSDWRINVVTTTPADGCTRGGIIKKGDATAATAFQTAAAAGTGGSGIERGILQAVNALSCKTVTGFPRAKSSIAVLIVSDEDNCSKNGSGCGVNDAWRTPAYLTSYLQNDLGRTLGKDARIYGIFWHPDVPAAQCSTGLNVATQYAKAVQDTNGVYGSICSSDYTATLRRISQDMATILSSQFTLTGDPDPSSLVVKVNGVTQTSGFTLAGRVITFTTIPPYGAKIEASYTVGAKPIRTRFPLDEIPAPETLEVLVNGVKADKSAYSVDAAAKELVFAAPPPANAKMSVKFRRDAPLLTDFPLDTKVRGSTLVVTVNGTSPTDYTLGADGVVRFSTPPPDGAVVVATFESFKSKVLEYPVALAGSSIKSWTVVDASSGNPVTATFQDGVLSVDEAEHDEGRKLIVRYENEASSRKELTLPEPPEDGSVTLEGAPEACKDSLTIEDKIVTFSCDEAPTAKLKLRYKYRASPIAKYELSEVVEPDTGVWQVFIDGIETAAYARDGYTITLSEEPSPTAVVKIVWAKGH